MKILEKIGIATVMSIVAPLMIVLLIPLSLLNGWVVSTMWEWLIEPTFTSAPDINTAEGWGLALFVGYLTKQFGLKMEENALLICLTMPFFALFGAWIINTFFM